MRTKLDMSQDNIRTKSIWTVVALSIVGLGILIILILQQLAPISGLQLYGRQLRGHSHDIVISSGDLPPVGGVHANVWQTCGIYTKPVATENAVHSLEHGAVWITYQPDLPEPQIEQLQQIVVGEPYLLLTPYPGQRTPVVLTAWAVQLEVDSVADERIKQFIRRYRLGPSTPERGGACSGFGGIGDPLELDGH